MCPSSEQLKHQCWCTEHFWQKKVCCMLHRKPSDLRMTLALNLWDYLALSYLSEEGQICCVNSWCIFWKVYLEFLNCTDNSCHLIVACNMLFVISLYKQLAIKKPLLPKAALLIYSVPVSLYCLCFPLLPSGSCMRRLSFLKSHVSFFCTVSWLWSKCGIKYIWVSAAQCIEFCWAAAFFTISKERYWWEAFHVSRRW